MLAALLKVDFASTSYLIGRPSQPNILLRSSCSFSLRYFLCSSNWLPEKFMCFFTFEPMWSYFSRLVLVTVFGLYTKVLEHLSAAVHDSIRCRWACIRRFYCKGRSVESNLPTTPPAETPRAFRLAGASGLTLIFLETGSWSFTSIWLAGSACDLIETLDYSFVSMIGEV